ncbi:Uncharacterized membrane protein SpoIIM, required for sporulation [Andreprevotia lacus DSM 23236]|jgi:uncharacterized membrane protein SpoIIM required for sporulation|uniref:Uncharacterized membrane protein SpoIIM, required for sporulation n=1 Tax=Andreprevotia lacus DSM 23236 TaxID=1121001 RepID=A0A1W1XU67_9NEIS|nr:stage II sporulation protein M [Andreprevotia lacus]SMC27081.1 Uncharacterized membrane protein SpoIIM, required for sporulation [Andreprevotia lacus DSM 23236]
MRQHQFESRHAALWQDIEQELASKQPSADLPVKYRALCNTLAVARQRGYSPSLVQRLDLLAINTHRLIYSAVGTQEHAFMRWVLRDFPRLVRAEWRVVALSLLVFYGLTLLVGLAVAWDHELAYSFMSPGQLANFEEMYRGGAHKLARRGSDDDVMMFGFYIMNNVSIGLRSFVGGLAFGVGALFFTAYNGAYFGVVAAWLSRDPATALNFWSFVITHSALEITGLLLASASGFKLGSALLLPGRRGRVAALRESAASILPMLLGAAMMIFLAAFFEGFWSARTDIPATAKFIVGGMLWLAVIAYFCLAGRKRAT